MAVADRMECPQCGAVWWSAAHREPHSFCPQCGWHSAGDEEPLRWYPHTAAVTDADYDQRIGGRTDPSPELVVTVGSRWQCVAEDSPFLGKKATVVYVNPDPQLHFESTLTLRFDEEPGDFDTKRFRFFAGTDWMRLEDH